MLITGYTQSLKGSIACYCFEEPSTVVLLTTELLADYGLWTDQGRTGSRQEFPFIPLYGCPSTLGLSFIDHRCTGACCLRIIAILTTTAVGSVLSSPTINVAFVRWTERRQWGGRRLQRAVGRDVASPARAATAHASPAGTVAG